MAEYIDVISPRCRVSFPDGLFVKKAIFEGGAEAYRVTLIFEPGTDLTEMKKAAGLAARKKFGNELPPALENPFTSGSKVNADRIAEGKDPVDGYEGATIIKAVSYVNKPKVVNEDVQPIMDESEIYGGCYAIAKLNPFGWKKGNKVGVSFGLIAIQKVGDGEPFGFGAHALDGFSQVARDSASSWSLPDVSDPFGDNVGGADSTEDDIPF